jgi:hypothetical protein
MLPWMWRRKNMASAKTTVAAGFPPLSRPDPNIAEKGAVRLGDGLITAGFPPLKRPDPKIAENGSVRLGDGLITAGFPTLE